MEDACPSPRQRSLSLGKWHQASTEISYFLPLSPDNFNPKQNKIKATLKTNSNQPKIHLQEELGFFITLIYLESFNLASLFFLFFSSLHEQIEFQANGEKATQECILLLKPNALNSQSPKMENSHSRDKLFT